MREQMTVLTLAPELQEYAEFKNVPLHGFGSDLGNGHWNVDGNRVAGELIAKRSAKAVFSNSAAVEVLLEKFCSKRTIRDFGDLNALLR